MSALYNIQKCHDQNKTTASFKSGFKSYPSTVKSPYTTQQQQLQCVIRNNFSTTRSFYIFTVDTDGNGGKIVTVPAKAYGLNRMERKAATQTHDQYSSLGTMYTLESVGEHCEL